MTQINDNIKPAQTVRPGIHTGNFLASMKHLFSSNRSFIGEMMQNARRAGATRIDFEFDPQAATLRASDDGCGIADFGVLVQMCESGWNEQTMLTDKPFGMGLFSLFFAGASTTFRSRCQWLQVRREDIAAQRELIVQLDPATHSRGTIVQIEQLEQALVTRDQSVHSPAYRRFGELAFYPVAQTIIDRARGFPITVTVNGIECPRPHALDAMPFEQLPVGMASICGVHRPQEDLNYSPLAGCERVTLYLQGLPIGTMPASTEGVIHLESALFTARMPDRYHLYDHEEQLAKVGKALSDRLRLHLVQQKAALDGKSFVRTWWDACHRHECAHLLDDIPWMPRRVFNTVDLLCLRGDSIWGAPDTSCDDLVSRQSFVDGTARAWRDSFDRPDDHPVAPLALSLMQRQDIWAAPAMSSADHWLHHVTPSFSDLQFEVLPRESGGQGSWADGGIWFSDPVTICLPKSVDVVVTSHCDPALRLSYAFTDGWLLAPAVEGLLDASDINMQPPMVCYEMSSGTAQGHPVDLLNSHTDEVDAFREEWRAADRDRWDNLVMCLRGSHLVDVVGAALRTAAQRPYRGQLGQLTLVTARVTYQKDDAFLPLQFQVSNLDEQAFWDRMSAALEASTQNSADLAQRLKAAFAAAVHNHGAKGARSAE